MKVETHILEQRRGIKAKCPVCSRETTVGWVELTLPPQKDKYFCVYCGTLYSYEEILEC